MTFVNEQTESRHEPKAPDALYQTALHIHANLAKVVLGLDDALVLATVAAISGGHLLLEDVPGVGKTVLANAIGKTLGVSVARIQGHPDLLPTDVTGVSIYSPEDKAWEFRHGPVFAHVVLLDELNRTPPRTQSALLEAMEEGQVSVDGRPMLLPSPHFVIATQNPAGQLGTFPLVESQLDRFSISTPLGYPNAATESSLTLAHGGREALASIKAVTTPNGWSELIMAVRHLPIAPVIADYAVAISRATRQAPGVRLGASPRASIALVRAAQAHAFLMQRTYVSPVDVQAMAGPVLAHRIVFESSASRSVLDHGRELIGSIVASLGVPQPQ